MSKMMVRYKVKPGSAAENEQYIARVFEQLQREQPPGVHYASFKLDDGVSFVHLVSREDGDGPSPLSELSAFRAFSSGLKARCDEPPVFVELSEIGSYDIFGK